MPRYVSVGIGDEQQQLPPGAWTSISWSKEYADSDHQHWDKGGPSLLTGSARYSLSVAATVSGVPQGTLIQARAIEVQIEDASTFDIGPVQDFVSVGNTTNLLYGLAADTIGKGRRVRFQLIQHGDAPATITHGSAKVFFWR